GVALTGQGYDTRNQRAALGYRRALETATGAHYTRFASITGTVLREAFAAREDDVIVLRYSSTTATELSGDLPRPSAQSAPATADAEARRIGFSGTMANDLSDAATVQVVDTDGEVTANGAGLRIQGATTITLALDARTDYKLSAADGWRGEAPQPLIDAALTRVAAKDPDLLHDAQVEAFSEIMSRASATWGESGAEVQALSTSRRLARYADGAED